VIASFAGDGRVFTWGWNDRGHLGLDDAEDRLSPLRCHLLSNRVSLVVNPREVKYTFFLLSLSDDEPVEELHCGSSYFFARVGVCVVGQLLVPRKPIASEWVRDRACECKRICVSFVSSAQNV
jgi:hypothetical protein